VSVGGTTLRLKEGAARELCAALTQGLAEIDRRLAATPAPTPAIHIVPSLGDDDGLG